MTDAIGGHVGAAVRVFESVAESSNEIFGFGLALPIVLGFVWLLLLRLFAGIFTYCMIILIGLVLLLLTLYLYLQAGAFAVLLEFARSNSTVLAVSTSSIAANDTLAQALTLANDTLAQALGLVADANDAVAALAPSELVTLTTMTESEVPALWYILAVIMTVITLVYIFSMCLARKQIKTAIALVKVGSMVIKDRPSTMFFPFNTLIANMLLTAYFIVIMLFLGTADITPAHFGFISDAMKSTATFIERIELYNRTISTGGVTAIEDMDNAAFYVNVCLYLYFIFGFLWTLVCARESTPAAARALPSERQGRSKKSTAVGQP